MQSIERSEYERAVNFYDSISLVNGIASVDYKESFDFNDDNIKDSSYYYIK